MRVSRETRDAAVDYSLGAIDYICREIGPRESGMPAERKAQEWLKDELLNNGWADEAEIEDFTVSRHGLVGFTKIVSVLLVLAAAMQFIAVFAPAVGLIHRLGRTEHGLRREFENGASRVFASEDLLRGEAPGAVEHYPSQIAFEINDTDK